MSNPYPTARLERHVNEARVLVAKELGGMSDAHLVVLLDQFNNIHDSIRSWAVSGELGCAAGLVEKAGALAAVCVLEELRRRAETRDMEESQQ